jgi:bifunctional non-homologous end joining protein LigD
MPVAWDDLMDLRRGAQWTVATAREHLSFQREDPWADYWTARQPLAPAMEALGYDATPPAKRRRAGVD